MQRFSESTHIGVLNKACKMMKVRKKLKSFSSNDHENISFVMHTALSNHEDIGYDIVSNLSNF